MISPSGRYVTVFNGEIYNYRLLRHKLKVYNKFKGTGDTETLVHCFDEWGVEKTVDMLDGMFAIAIFDNKTDKLFLTRDFAGIKPLYFGKNENGVVFASQYDQIAGHNWFKSEKVDNKVLSLYLKMHYVPAPYALLTNTYQVMPGEIVTVSNTGHIEKKRYWELPVSTGYLYSDKEQAVEFLTEELNRTVKSQLRSDVPLGAFLSGGIDSALICSFATENIAEKLSTFTIGSDSKKHDETEDARIVAEAINATVHLEKMDSRYALKMIDESFDSVSEPFADFSIIPTYLVSKLSRKDVTVTLSGDGGDELFFGYERFESVAKNISYANYPYFLKYLMYGTDKVLFQNKHLNSGVLFDTQGDAHRGLHSRFKNGLLKNVHPAYDDEIVRSGFGVYNYSNSKDVEELLNKMRYAEFYGMMQKTLRKVDQASMGVGLEVRVPFLSKQFIEASIKISPFLSFGNGKKKEILKELLRRRIPQARITEEKRGFSIPLSRWINEDLKVYFDDVLLSDSMINHFGFNRNGIEQLLKMHHDDGVDLKWPLFTILSLFKWKERIQR
jgi:asparagine synthase (glutamine-hydrolysing)